MSTAPGSIYLDNSATTAVDPAVVAEMLPFLTEHFGNASSTHRYGQRAKQAVEAARQQIADLLGVAPTEIVILAGGTEGDNLAIRGIAEAHASHGKHLLTSEFEHSAVLNTCRFLESEGWEVTYLPVNSDGVIRVEDVEKALRPETTLVSIMHVNNEIGTIQPLADIGRLVASRRAAGQRHLHFHTDAVQSVGKIPVNARQLGVDLISLSGHKFGAPKGVGALYVRRGVRLQAQMTGGHQERDRRSGTEAVPLIVALGKACELASLRLDEFDSKVRELRDYLEDEILKRIPYVTRNGNQELRAPHISNLNFEHCEGEGLMISLDLKGIAVSTGSACASGSIEPSHVLKALGLDVDTGRGSLRFSLSTTNTREEIDRVLEVLPAVVEKLRKVSPRAGARG